MPAKKTLGRVVKGTAMPNLSKSFTPMQLASAITAKRTGMKLTLVDVSKALCLSKPTLIKIEKGDTSVKFINILSVMEYLGLAFTLIIDDVTDMDGSVSDVKSQWF